MPFFILRYNVENPEVNMQPVVALKGSERWVGSHNYNKSTFVKFLEDITSFSNTHNIIIMLS